MIFLHLFTIFNIINKLVYKYRESIYITMKYTISASYISTITGDNIYQKKRDFLITFWKKNDLEDFKTYCEISKFKIQNDFEKIKDISKKHNINVQSELTKCLNTKNITDLTQNKTEILNKVKDLSEKDKKIIQESILNVSHTNFGIKNENDALKIYQEYTKTNIMKDDKYKIKNIYSCPDYDILIGGKIDGINIDDGSIVEIKNRMKKLFNTLRSYEKVQLMCYLYIFNAKKGFLVEALKNKTGTNIGIIECTYDNEYMQTIIVDLKNFITFYRSFINNHKMKLDLLQNEDEINFD